MDDVIEGYLLLAEKGKYGDVYNQGSMRTNSVMSYLLMSLEEAGYPVSKIETFKGEKVIKEPNEPDKSKIFGLDFEKTKVDGMMLRGELEFAVEDGGVIAHAGREKDKNRLRPGEIQACRGAHSPFRYEEDRSARFQERAHCEGHHQRPA